MSWKIDQIRERQKELVEARFADASREDIMAALIELRTAAYPFEYVTSHLDMKSWRGTTASSALFHWEHPEKPGFAVWNTETSDFDCVQLKDEELAAAKYVTADSIQIEDGSKLGDNFEVLSVHQQAPCAYVGCGSIWMEDVRRLGQVFALTTPIPATAA
jgi:hypothetical protein